MSELTTVLPRGVAAVERSVGSLPEPLAAELVDAVRRLDTEDAVFLANLDEAIVEIVELLDECPVGVTAECLRKRLLLVVPEPVKAATRTERPGEKGSRRSQDRFSCVAAF